MYYVSCILCLESAETVSLGSRIWIVYKLFAGCTAELSCDVGQKTWVEAQDLDWCCSSDTLQIGQDGLRRHSGPPKTLYTENPTKNRFLKFIIYNGT
jgi:hypothetical protein